MPRSEPTESEASQTGRRNKKEKRAVTLVGYGLSLGKRKLRQLPSLTVGNISKIDGSRDAHFLESNGEKGKNYRFIEECNEQRRSLLYCPNGPNRQAEINS